MHSNPFEVHKHELTVDRHKGNRFLAKSWFWRYMDFIPNKHVYTCASVEYRSIKVMIVETFLIILTAAIFSVCAAQQYGTAGNQSLLSQRAFWEGSIGSVTNASTFWTWMSSDFSDRVFSSQLSISDVSANLNPPPGWMSMTPGSLFDYVELNGIFSVDSDPVWAPLTVGGTPFAGNVMLGPVRLRQYATNVDGAELVSKAQLIGTPDEIAEAFKWKPANVTQQAALAAASGDEVPGSGYVLDLPVSVEAAASRIDLLKEWSWIDASTKAIVVELSVLNSRTELVTSVVYLFELDAEGLIVGSLSIITVPVHASRFEFREALMLVSVGTFCSFGLFTFFVIWVAGLRDFFTYAWNLLDVVLLVLFFVWTGLALGELSDEPSALHPALAPAYAMFKPFSVFVGRFAKERRLAAMLLVLLWIRLIKPLALIGFLRPTVRTIEGTISRLFWIFLPFLLVVGILVAMFAAWLSSTASETFFTLWFLFSSGADLNSAFLADRNVSVWIYLAFLAVMYFFLPCVCLAAALSAHSAYTTELAAAKLFSKQDRLGAAPMDINPNSFWHSSPIAVFFYTWYFRLKGVELIPEKDEDIGFPEEQVIDLDLLPELIQRRWEDKRAELVDIIETRTRKNRLSASFNVSKFNQRMTRLMSAASKSASRVFSQVKAVKSSAKPTADRDNVITRIQLQRLLDYDDELVEILREAEGFQSPPSSPPSSPLPPSGSDSMSDSSKRSGPNTIRAIDVIRRYNTPEATGRKMMLESLLGTSKLRADQSHRAVRKGLSEVVTEVEKVWKSQLVEFGEQLAQLTDDLARIQHILDRRPPSTAGPKPT